MYNGLLHAHSAIRWVALILIIYSVFNALMKRKSGDFTDGDRKLTLFTLISAHVQGLLGLVLYFISPKVSFAEGFMKDSVLRFYAMEHILLMVIALVLITMGYSKMKKSTESSDKFKRILIFYGIALLLIIAAIPWPFRDLGAAWF
jgi:multisubunit Na+/H+ antiporter MnhB subunit